MSLASMRARGNALAARIARHPEPVQRSRTRAVNDRAPIDVERKAVEPGFVQEIGHRDALVDAPPDQRLDLARPGSADNRGRG